MERFFNIAGPCVAADHYMLPATERLPEVIGMIRRKLYFVIHAPRQSGKTTALKQLVRDINGSGERVAMYCSLEALQNVMKVETAMPMVISLICEAMRTVPSLAEFADEFDEKRKQSTPSDDAVKGVMTCLSAIARKCGKPFVVFFDEADCLCFDPLVMFLRQLRNGYVNREDVPFPASVALVGLRNIKDYKMRVRPDGESVGQASPFNVITKVLPMRLFSDAEMRSLYAQHTTETGQVFEEGALAEAYRLSCGQPYLVNALARWCVEEIHHDDHSQPITAADMDEAKEKIIREQGTHLDSMMEKLEEPRVRCIVEPVMLGGTVDRTQFRDDVSYCIDLGLLVDDQGRLKPANPIYAETIGRFLTRGVQSEIHMLRPENPWVREDGLDMNGLMSAFQQFWRENADANAVPFHYREAYPHLVLQAFLQRVINGGGQIIREMALGSGRLDLGVKFRDAIYAVEVKTAAYYAKSPEAAHEQMVRYMDRLGVGEGWLVVADSDLAKPWDCKISTAVISQGGKTIHVVRC